MRRLVIAASCLALMVALPASASDPGPVANSIGSFHADCSYSHSLSDDPIVFPGQPGASHLHSFFGARTTDAFSTPESIKASSTSCIRHNAPVKDTDRSAYWFPTLYVNDVAVEAAKLGAYYKTGFRHMQAIEAFPAGLKVIAGSAAGGPQHIGGAKVWQYICPKGTIAPGSATTAPTCAGNEMWLSIEFPDCWDGTRLDSPDHKSHMAYSGGTPRSCRPSHPRTMPILELTLRYPTSGGPTTRLASGAINTAHADFMNGWDQAKQEQLVRDCLNVDKYCGGGDVPAHE